MPAWPQKLVEIALVLHYGRPSRPRGVVHAELLTSRAPPIYPKVMQLRNHAQCCTLPE